MSIGNNIYKGLIGAAIMIVAICILIGIGVGYLLNWIF